jgi:NAD(P)-dependent dehydrogenase (short-subunit alcohol dehydrogenase family)
MLNAGIALDKFEQVDGLEKQFVVNHLGHFILTNRLLDGISHPSWVHRPAGGIGSPRSRSHAQREGQADARP